MLPQSQMQVTADLDQRIADHQAAIASALSNGLLYQPNSPLVLLADGDSWFDYPLGAFPPLIATTDIIAQLPALCAQKPYILNLSHYGDATTTELGLTRVQKIISAITNPTNGPFDAILFSGGGNDIVGDPFCIWLNDASHVGGDPAQALDMSRFNAVLGLIEASYLDLIGVRNDNLPNAPIFVHAYDFAIPSGIGALRHRPVAQAFVGLLRLDQPGTSNTNCPRRPFPVCADDLQAGICSSQQHDLCADSGNTRRCCRLGQRVASQATRFCPIRHQI
jgi:hypothetical protein